MGSVRHLACRFLGSLSPRPLDPADDEWVGGLLSVAERDLWKEMSRPDRKHAAGVGRAASRRLGADADQVWIVAALLHDVGKSLSALGTWSRVVATLVDRAGLRGRLTTGGRSDGYRSRLSTYLRHDSVGAARLAAAGADPRVVAWAADHHRPEEHWSVPIEIGRVLQAVDDD